MSEGSLIPLSALMAFTVVPNRSAIEPSVSPGLTRYVRRVLGLGFGVAEGDGRGVDVAAGLSLGPAVGDVEGEGGIVGDSDGPGLPRATPPGDPLGPGGRAKMSAAAAATITRARPPCPIARRSTPTGIANADRPRSITTGAVRAMGRTGKTGAKDRRVSAAARYRSQEAGSARQNRRCVSSPRRVAGFSAPHTCSRDGDALRHSPLVARRYGQTTSGLPGWAVGSRSVLEVIGSRIAKTSPATGRTARPEMAAPEGAGNAEILATTYVPERLPSQYLRRWRA